MRTRRMAFIVGMVGVLLLDLFALDDLTTVAGGVLEGLFLVASLPALGYLGRGLWLGRSATHHARLYADADKHTLG